MIYAIQNCVTEWSYSSGKPYDDPFNEVELDVAFTGPDGVETTVPAFWSGDQTWRLRFSAHQAGTHRYRTICSDTKNKDLHGKEGQVQVSPYKGDNPLFLHGPLTMDEDRRHLRHRDGTPFFWLGDTWWMGLCARLKWPGEFQELAADRRSKGFTLVQIVAGLYPDMEPFDQRGANEAGFPWDKSFKSINPSYFDMADLRIEHLVRMRLVPCIVGSWGYFMDFAGLEAMKRHWRYLVARWGAYPVVWCLAGEVLMPYYLSEAAQKPEKGKQWQAGAKAKWSDMARYLRDLDPKKHPVCAHQGSEGGGRGQVEEGLVDFDMLQTGHSGLNSLAPTVNQLTEALAREPRLPVLDGEVNYEGIQEASREEIQRFVFLSCMLCGAAGHTYGANGLWQMNSRDTPYGPSPHGTSWGDVSWDQAYKLPGSGQLGMLKGLLERFSWWRFEEHPEWVEPHQSKENRFLPYAAGIPGKVRVIFIPADACWQAWSGKMLVKGLEKNARYRGYYFNPKTGKEHDLGDVKPDAQGDYRLPKVPIFQDWVVVLTS